MADEALESPARQRIGVFGGSFDPPHRSHARLARDACRELDLDRLLVVPAGDHPTKARDHAPAADRLAMCRAAFADLPRVEVSTIELQRDGPSYTVDTLRTLREQAEAGGRPVDLFLLVGADNVAGLAGWREADALPRLARLAVQPRVSHEAPPVPEGFAGAVVMLDSAADDISSTTIRARLARGENGLDELDPAVERIATTRALYAPARRRADTDTGSDGGPGTRERR